MDRHNLPDSATRRATPENKPENMWQCPGSKAYTLWPLDAKEDYFVTYP